MKALKALVAGMGLLIVIGIGLVGYGLTREKAKLQPTTVVTVGSLEPFDTKLPVPHGAKLEQVTVIGERIVLRFTGPDGDKMVLVDSHTGQLAGTITLVPDNH